MDRSLLDRIYVERATMLLEDYCVEMGINFDRLNEFLVKNNAVICGSVPLSCFDNTFTPNDIDIFLFISGEKIHKCYIDMYKELVLCFEKLHTIRIDKHPIVTSFKGNSCKYMYKFYQESDIVLQRREYEIAEERRLQNCTQDEIDEYWSNFYHNQPQEVPSNIEYDKGTKLIDLVIFNNSLSNFNSKSDFVCNEFYWNGLEWHIPVLSLSSFLCYKIVEIKRLTTIDLLSMYEPNFSPTDIESFDEIFISRINTCTSRIKAVDPNYKLLSELTDKFHYFGEKKLFSVDLYLLMKTLYRIHKYKSRGYIFPNLPQWFEKIFQSFPTITEYQEQIDTTSQITLRSGHIFPIHKRRKLFSL